MNSNEHYGRLNNRFDERVALLRKNGFRSEVFEIPQTGCKQAFYYLPSNNSSTRRHTTVMAQFILYADDFSYEDKLKDIVFTVENFGGKFEL